MLKICCFMFGMWIVIRNSQVIQSFFHHGIVSTGDATNDKTQQLFQYPFVCIGLKLVEPGSPNVQSLLVPASQAHCQNRVRKKPGQLPPQWN